MNIPNVNNPDDQVGRNQDIIERMREDQQTGRTEGAQEPQQEETIYEPAEQAPTQPARDTFQTTENRRLVEELTREVENIEETPPREEVVAKARERVQTDYYNTREFIGNLATRLINTDLNT